MRRRNRECTGGRRRLSERQRHLVRQLNSESGRSERFLRVRGVRASAAVDLAAAEELCVSASAPFPRSLAVDVPQECNCAISPHLPLNVIFYLFPSLPVTVGHTVTFVSLPRVTVPKDVSLSRSISLFMLSDCVFSTCSLTSAAILVRIRQDRRRNLGERLPRRKLLELGPM